MNHQVLFLGFYKAVRLGPLSPDAASKLNVLGHDGYPLGMDSCQVSVLKETNQVSLGSLLEGKHCAGLEPQVGLEVLGNLTHQPLERQLADEQLSGLLVLANFTQGDSSWPVPAQGWKRIQVPGSKGAEAKMTSVEEELRGYRH